VHGEGTCEGMMSGCVNAPNARAGTATAIGTTAATHRVARSQSERRQGHRRCPNAARLRGVRLHAHKRTDNLRNEIRNWFENSQAHPTRQRDQARRKVATCRTLGEMCVSEPVGDRWLLTVEASRERLSHQLAEDDHADSPAVQTAGFGPLRSAASSNQRVITISSTSRTGSQP